MLLVDRAACTEYAGLSHRSEGETNGRGENRQHEAWTGAGPCCPASQHSHRAPALPEV